MQSSTIDKIAAAIAEVVKQVSHVEKTGRNAAQRYTYASDTDLTIAMRGPMAAHGLSLLPVGQTVVVDELPSRNGPKMVHRLTLRWRLVHTSGQWIEVETTGQGWDSGDKALFKAQTGAKKYALHLIFLLPTVDDPEDERLAPKEDPPKSEKPPPPKPSLKPAIGGMTRDEWESELKHASFEKDRARFMAQINDLGITYDQAKDICFRKAWPKPSTLPAERRAGLLKALQKELQNNV